MKRLLYFALLSALGAGTVLGDCTGTFRITFTAVGGDLAGLNGKTQTLTIDVTGTQARLSVDDPPISGATGSIDLTNCKIDMATGTVDIGGGAITAQFKNVNIQTLGVQGQMVLSAPSGQATYNFAGPRQGPGSVAPSNEQTGRNAADTKTDPISTATGELYSLFDPDLRALTFQRYYGSLLKSNGVSRALGANWMHNYDVSLTLGASDATVTLFRGRTVRFTKTASGWQLAGPDQFGFQLANAGDSYQFLDPRSNLIYTFNSSGALTRIEDRNGNVLTVTPSASGPTQISDGLGRTLTLTYASGKLTRVQDQAGRSVTFTYTGDNLAAVTDANGKSTAHIYTSSGALSGLMTTAILPAGNKPLTQTFDPSGRATQQTDSRGNTLKIDFDKPAPGFTTVTNPLSVAVQQTHQNQSNFTQYTDPAGQAMTFTYDANNRRNSVTDRFGDKTSVTFHSPSGYPASYTDAEGNTTRYSHTAQTQGPLTFYNLTRITYADGTSISLTYDDKGNVASLTDQAGKVWFYTYNSRGQVTTRKNPAGGVTTYTYNNDATLTSVQLPSGDLFTYTYDDKKRPARISYPDGTSRTFAYDIRDNLLQMTDEHGKVRQFQVNDNNRLARATDAANQATTFSYDGDERTAAVTDRVGKTSNFRYDEVGRLKTATNPAGESTTLGYDTQDRLASILDPLKKVLGLAYDKEGILASVADALSQTWSFNSDKLGRITRVTTPLSNAFDFGYDKLGRLTSRKNPLGQAVGYTYDSRGLIAGVAHPAGISASLVRTDLGQISSITDPNGNTWTRSYDSSGRLTSQTDPLSRVTSYLYDSRSRISGATLPEGSLTFTRDAAGNVIGKRYSDGTELSFAYDDNNRPVSGAGFALGYDAAGRIISSNGLVIARDDTGRISAITHAPGKSVRYAYDARGLLAKVTDWAGGTTDLAYDDARRLISITRPNGVVTAYAYAKDASLSRITESKGSSTLSSIALTRDAAGKLASADRSIPRSVDPASGSLSLAYDAAHEVQGFTYDKMARLTGDGLRTYAWDLASRLASYAGADGSASFTYDAYGMRISRTSGGRTQNYALNYALGLPSVAIVREGAADRRYYIYLPNGRLLHSIDAGDNSRRFYHFDEVGSTVFLTDDAGAVTDTYGITPYGEVVSASGSTENPFTFLGAQGVMQEGSTGLFYMRARYYDSATARLLSPTLDPSASPKSINPYQYGWANPLRFTNPSGR